LVFSLEVNKVLVDNAINLNHRIRRKPMKIAVIIVRVLMGLLFLFASITVLFNLIPKPELTGPVKTFNDGMDAAVYFLPVLKVTELLCGLAFLVGRFVPLATILIAPIIVQIFLFHLFMDQTGLPVAIFLVLANSFLAYAYRKNYASLFEAKPALS
jgi:uncharacterized membrane protein YphA (DoxX/SURF4 family)